MSALYKALYATGPGTDRPMPGGRLLFAGYADALAQTVLEEYQEQVRVQTTSAEDDIPFPTTLNENPFGVDPVPDAAFDPLIKELQPDQDDIGRLGIDYQTAMDPEALRRLEYG